MHLIPSLFLIRISKRNHFHSSSCQRLVIPRMTIAFMLAVITALTWSWIDSSRCRTAATLYTASGLVTAVNHGGEMNIILNPTTLPWRGGNIARFSGSREKARPSETQSAPLWRRTRGESSSSLLISLPHWLMVIAVAGSGAGLLVATEILHSIALRNNRPATTLS